MKRILLPGLVLALISGCGDLTTSTTSTSTQSGGTFSLGFSDALSRTLENGQGGSADGQIVVTADVDADGKADVLVANPSTHSVSLFKGQSGSSVTDEVTFAVGPDGPRAIATGDFNGDGRPDLAALGSGQVSFLFNDGNGSFPAHVEVSTGTDNRGLTVADFDGDGRADVAVSDAGGVPLHLIYSDGTTNAAGYPVHDYNSNASTLQTPVWIAAGDLNQDGQPDLAFANAAAQFLTFWTNTGDGARATLFGPDGTQNAGLDIPTGSTAHSVALADFNRDGRPDLLTAFGSSSDAFARLYLNTANGISLGSTGTQSVSAQPIGVAVTDLNNDGYPDAVVASATGLNATGTGEVDMLFGNGLDGLGTQFRCIAASGQTGAAVAAGDFNGDGLADLVLAGPGHVNFFFNTSKIQ